MQTIDLHDDVECSAQSAWLRATELLVQLELEEQLRCVCCRSIPEGSLTVAPSFSCLNRLLVEEQAWLVGQQGQARPGQGAVCRT